jgi:hypothetical protein
VQPLQKHQIHEFLIFLQSKDQNMKHSSQKHKSESKLILSVSYKLIIHPLAYAQGQIYTKILFSSFL